ncbi:unnamed protein product [Darwinula stevensoni]|uniref:SERTA domain-containing protein n=1 Tax=Darwinula stevensoni TaxID=69355 RepID=A0A7R8X6N8_9CRUS|nr:unnamed protein product [Darwinula stevensoni]CAG0879661.1 unnamed protein product [Darwinula stevensoni]
MTLVDNYLTGVPSGVEGIMDFDSVERTQLDDWDHVEDDLEKLMGQMIRKQPPKKSPSTDGAQKRKGGQGGIMKSPPLKLLPARRPSMLWTSNRYRLREERRAVYRVTMAKLRAIEDPEAFLRRSVLINNTFKSLQKREPACYAYSGRVGIMTPSGYAPLSPRPHQDEDESETTTKRARLDQESSLSTETETSSSSPGTSSNEEEQGVPTRWFEPSKAFNSCSQSVTPFSELQSAVFQSLLASLET